MCKKKKCAEMLSNIRTDKGVPIVEIGTRKKSWFVCWCPYKEFLRTVPFLLWALTLGQRLESLPVLSSTLGKDRHRKNDITIKILRGRKPISFIACNKLMAS